MATLVSPADTYRAKVAELERRPTGANHGTHSFLLSVAHAGVAAGVSDEQMFRDIRDHVRGTRTVPDKEITDTIRKARLGKSSPSLSSVTRPRTPPSPKVDGSKLLAEILARGDGATEVDIWELSPVFIGWPPERDPIELLHYLYGPDDFLFIGDRYGKTVQTVETWTNSFIRGAPVPPHITPNTFTGSPAKTGDGKESYRCDAAVAGFRFATVEFDSMPREKQLAFFLGVRLPVCALIDSGGKSIHGWIRVDAKDADDWTRRVEQQLFSMLVPLGVDPACRNESRLSRMPGHYRAEKNRWQRLLYLNPTGSPLLP